MGEYKYNIDVNRLKTIEININDLMGTISNKEILIRQNIALFNGNKNKKYLTRAKQNLTNMQKNVNKLIDYYTELNELSETVTYIDNNQVKVNIEDVINKINRENIIINDLKTEISSIEGEISFTTKEVKSNYYEYNIILIITLSLIIMVLLSYFYETNIIYEYIILGILIIYVIYFLYNLL